MMATTGHHYFLFLCTSSRATIRVVIARPHPGQAGGGAPPPSPLWAGVPLFLEGHSLLAVSARALGHAV